MNNELRDAAVRAISNYIHQELFEITQSADMLPFIKDQAESIIISIDKSITINYFAALIPVNNQLTTP